MPVVWKISGGRSNIFAIEDEFHVVFHCEAYSDIRHVYIDKELLSCANEYIALFHS